jgi:hypothetical protein
MERESVYVGIDIDEEASMISFYHADMTEPETISTIAGSEMYQIPTYLSKKKGMGQWFFGREAKRQVNMGNAYGVEQLYQKALRNQMINLDGETYQARDLMVIYFKKLLSIPGTRYGNATLEKLVVTVGHVDRPTRELFLDVAKSMGITKEQMMMIDRRESFYYYALNQDPSLFIHDVMLFHCDEKGLFSVLLKRNQKTIPQVVTLTEETYEPLTENRDEAFLADCQKAFEGNVISAVYLTGDGFEGDWMKSSLKFLCNNRRAFMGKNLYSKGACFAGAIKDERLDWPFVFIGDNELKLNVSLKISDQNEMRFLTLIEAGQSWYETEGECEVILDGSSEVTVWIQKPDSRQADVEVLELTDLPERENRTTRIRINAKPVSHRKIRIELRDLGFGEIVPSTNQVWIHTIGVE